MGINLKRRHEKNVGMMGLPTKDSVRDIVRLKRQSLGDVWLNEHSAAVTERVVSLPEFKNAGMVGCYLSAPGEVITDGIIQESWARRKKVLVPAWRPESAVYEMVFLEQDAGLDAGPFNIQEPKEKNWCSLEMAGIVFVPGVAFDTAGTRVGHGRGYYDRILAGPVAETSCYVALGFEFQVFDRLPAEEWDMRMDLVITEKATTRVNRGSAAIDPASS